MVGSIIPERRRYISHNNLQNLLNDLFILVNFTIYTRGVHHLQKKMGLILIRQNFNKRMGLIFITRYHDLNSLQHVCSDVKNNNKFDTEILTSWSKDNQLVNYCWKNAGTGTDYCNARKSIQ